VIHLSHIFYLKGFKYIHLVMFLFTVYVPVRKDGLFLKINEKTGRKAKTALE